MRREIFSCNKNILTNQRNLNVSNTRLDKFIQLIKAYGDAKKFIEKASLDEKQAILVQLTEADRLHIVDTMRKLLNNSNTDHSSIHSYSKTHHQLAASSKSHNRNASKANITLISNIDNPTIHFTGRITYLQELEQNLQFNPNFIITQSIIGLGGVGKTQLARQYALEHEQDYQLIWWCNANTLDSDYWALAEKINMYIEELNIKRKIDLTDDNRKKIREEIKQILRNLPRWLLIIDDAENEIQVREYLPRNGHIIITSRNQHWQQAKTIPLSILDPKESLGLLKEIIKETGSFSIDDERDAKELANLLGHLPLALTQAGFYIKETGRSLRSYIDEFKHEHQVLWLKEDAPHDYPNTLATTWKINIKKIQERCGAAVKLMNHCAFLAPTHIQSIWLQSLIKNQFSEAICILKAYSMMEYQEPMLSMHALVQMIIREECKPEEQKEYIENLLKIISSELEKMLDDDSSINNIIKNDGTFGKIKRTFGRTW